MGFINQLITGGHHPVACHGQKHIQKWEKQCFWNSQRVAILMGFWFLLMIGCHGQSWIATLWLVKHG
jgi:hypothetical protein